MKKRFLVMAMAGVALAGCVSEDVSDVKQKEQGKLIGFDQLMLYNTASRAGFYGEIGSGVQTSGSQRYSYPKEENFMVYACEHTGDFSTWETTPGFWNVKSNDNNPNPTLAVYHTDYRGWFPKNGDNFIYKEWPSGKKVTFAAYSPADLNPYNMSDGDETPDEEPGVNYTQDGFTITGFQVADSPTRQIDLLYSNRSEDNTVDKLQIGLENKYNGIPLIFNHALSSIHVGLVNSTDIAAGIEVTLTKVAIERVSNKANFTENSSPAWDDHSGNKTYTCYQAGTNPVVFPRAIQHVSEAIVDQDKTETETFNSLLLIPQSTEGINLVISYTVTDNNNSTTESKDDIRYSIKDLSGTVNSTTETVSAWEPGKRYTYVFRYGAAATGKDYIYFAPETNLWTNVNNIMIDLK